MELFNNAVLIATPPNWAEAPVTVDTFHTSIAGGVTGAEDRAALRCGPLFSLEFSLLAELGEREELTARLQAALKSGRACVPRWGNTQLLVADAAPLRARTELAHWPWRAGQWAIFFPPAGDRVNLHLRVACGADDRAEWHGDYYYLPKGWPTPRKVATLETVTPPDSALAAPEAIYRNKREVIGINEPARLTWRLAGWEPGLPCQVRLHFAEIYASIETASAQMVDITITGATTLLMENHEPYAVTGDFNRGEVLTFDLCPDAEGVVEISLLAKAGNQPDPEGPGYWPCSLNGFEVVQDGVTLDQPAYEVRQLGKSQHGRLSWTTPLTGRYPAGSRVYPLLFGKLTVNDLAALTNHLGTLRIKVAEPLGEGEVATPGTCPVEVKHPSSTVIWNDGYAPEWVGAPCAEPSSPVESAYMWAINGTDPNGGLTPAQIGWHIAMFENEKAKIPGVVWGPTFWQYTATTSSDLSADTKYGTGITDPDDRTGDHEILFNYRTTLAAQYCPGGGAGPTPIFPPTPSYGYCQA